MGSWEIGRKKWEIWEIGQEIKWEMEDLDPNWENMREHLFAMPIWEQEDWQKISGRLGDSDPPPHRGPR